MDDKFTEKQGQYLAFIHHYILINGCSPTEADMQKFFMVTAPTVHQMIVKLEKKELITKEPGIPRSIKLAIKSEHLPSLDVRRT